MVARCKRPDSFGIEWTVDNLANAQEGEFRLDLRETGLKLRRVTDAGLMPIEPYKPKIFISYAHADEPERPGDGEVKWLSFVTGFLRPALKHDAVEIWIDLQMSGGADWEREIASKLRACDIFLLLVSRFSTSSDYIVDKEIAIIRARQEKGQDVHFYPLVLTPTPEKGLDVVRDKNLRPRDGKTLSSYPVYDREQKMKDAADEIAKIAREITARRMGSLSHAIDTQRALELARVASAESDALADRLRGQSSQAAVAIAGISPMLGAPVSVFISYRQEDLPLLPVEFAIVRRADWVPDRCSSTHWTSSNTARISRTSGPKRLASATHSSRS